MTIQLQTSERLSELLTHVFPSSQYDYQHNIIYAFGYGSGVLSQSSSSSSSSSQQIPSSSHVVDNNNYHNNNNNHHHHQNTNTTKMIDIILVVNNVQQFHIENLKYNPQHYNFYNNNNTNNMMMMTTSQLLLLLQRRAERISWVQCHTVPFSQWQSYFSNPGLYFHLVHYDDDDDDIPPNINTNHNNNSNNSNNNRIAGIKYGIISYSTFIHDLQHWSHLYIAGRMQKPIVSIPLQQHITNKFTIQQQQQQYIQSVQEQSNLPAALATAILYQWYQNQQQQQGTSITSSSSTTFSLRDIYQQIIQLSYSGDPRMGMFEDTNKIQNIITAQYHLFHQLYQPIIQPFIQDGLIYINHNTTNNNNNNNNTPTTTSSTSSLLLDTVNVIPQSPPEQHCEISYNWDHPLAHDRLWQCLPQRIRQQCRITTNHNSTKIRLPSSSSSSYDEMQSVRQLQQMISQSIVAPAARYQSMKGLYSTGWKQSIVYLYRKFTKGRYGKVVLPVLSFISSSSTTTTAAAAATTVPTATTTLKAATNVTIPKKN